MSRPVPTSAEIAALVNDLSLQRESLISLLQSRSMDGCQDLVNVIDEIGAKLLVADEELRVQNEQLTMSARRLDLLAAADEELFANAPSAYLQTDVDGLIVRYNHAARIKLGMPARSERSRTIASLIEPAQRIAVRTLISRARAGAAAEALAPLESVLVRPDGTHLPVVFVLRRSGLEERALLHWEVRDLTSPQLTDTPPSTPASTPASASTLIHNGRPMQAIAEAAQQVARQDTPQRTMVEVVTQARSAVPGCDEAGITLERANRRLPNPAATSDLAAQCDAIELELGEGPCLDALRSNQVIRSDDLALDERWPAFSRRASALGVKALLAVPLSAPRGMFGALNLYAGSVNAFDHEAELIASTYASHAAIAIMHAELESNLRVGLATREEIGRAVGILMERHRVTAPAAFDMLVYASQRSHRKLRYVATWVNETGEDPDKIAP